MLERQSASDHLGPIPRRTLLLGAGAVVVAACTSSDSELAADGPAATSAPDSTDAPAPDSTDAPAPATSATPTTSTPGDEAAATEPELTPLTGAEFADLAVCTVLPETTAGPFPTLDPLDRRDVTEGYPGHPLRLGLRVVDAECLPIPGALVEIWHADATGDYSSYTDNGDGKDEGQGSTFLRGFQTTDADGIAEFQTIYPGWYTGRAIHIHIGVQLDGRELLTSQLYFDEAYTAEVLATGPYAEFGPVDTTWDTDGLIGDPTVDGTAIALTPAPTTNGSGTLGLANLGVRT
ncbi:MAG: protocatechuate dioxygenase [Ilumatobacter sp.]